MNADIEHRVATAFARDVASHRMIVRLDHGLHRHLVFEQREHAWNNRFELITAPGSLTITGDRGAHTFRRMVDMFQFFRTNSRYNYGINPGYWAEKLPDGGRSVKKYSEDALRVQLDEELKAYAEDYSDRAARYETSRERYDAANWSDRWPMRSDGPREPEKVHTPDEIREVITDHDDDGLLGHADGARDLLRELERIGFVCDTWEWDLSDWDFHFLWNLHAIAWGVRQYDTAVKSGLHVVRTGCMAWDTPLPTVAPTPPDPRKPAKDTPINFTVTMATAGGAL